MNTRLNICCVAACLILAQPLGAADWPRFRGPQGSGVASAPNLPVEWTLEDYKWKTELEGLGHSSPVVREGRVFVSTGSKDGTRRELHCLDAKSGKILWTRALLKLSKDKMHAQSSYASSTPAVSNETVVVTFADNDHYMVSAYGLDGTPRWKRNLGKFNGEHGHGASPIIWNGMVFLPNDQDGESSYVALKEATGEVLWSVSRETGVASYSTPLILELAEGQPQLITTSNGMGMTSLDPATGRTLWSTNSLPQRTVSSPVVGDALIFQTCGAGGRGHLLVGVNPSLENAGESRVEYKVEKRIPYVPTPVFYEDHLYLWGDNGVVMCVKPTSTEPVWVERADGDFSSSPICVNGCLYNVTEDGEVVVIRAAPQFEILGRSPLGEASQATPAVANGRMYFHTAHHVLCLAPRTGEERQISDAE